VNPFSLAGKTAMVTGASRGIGLGLAKALADSGANPILVARDEQAFAKAAKDLRRKQHRRAVPWPSFCQPRADLQPHRIVKLLNTLPN
jgi:short-subunit dehydrogenase